MVKKYSDLELNDTTLALALKTVSSTAGWSNKKKQEKYLIIDWRGAPITAIDFTQISEDHLMEYFLGDLEYINNPTILLAAFRQVETPNEELLWNHLVDSHIISDKLYQAQTYEENFKLLMKVTKFVI